LNFSPYVEDEYLRLNKLFNTIKFEAKKKYYDKKISEMGSNSKMIWSLYRELTFNTVKDSPARGVERGVEHLRNHVSL